MGIDIAIPLKRDRFTNYYDLRMTLRSIEANLTGYNNIFIIGEKPGWISNVTHLPCGDIAGRKAFSIYRKMMLAADTVPGSFISWADDTYLLEQLDVADIKCWYDGTLKEWAHKNVHPLYRTIIKNTWSLFPDGLFYNVHTPCIYDSGKFKQLSKYNWLQTQYLIKSVYFNTFPADPVAMKDPKRYKGLFYSTGDRQKPEDIKMLEQLFPNPSRYETNNKAHAKAARSMAKAAG